MIWDPEGDVVHVGEMPEGWDELAAMDSEEASVTDGDVMAQGSFGASEDFDAMMVESGGLEGDAEGSTVQVETVAAETVEDSDPVMPEHDEVGKHLDSAQLYAPCLLLFAFF